MKKLCVLIVVVMIRLHAFAKALRTGHRRGDFTVHSLHLEKGRRPSPSRPCDLGQVTQVSLSSNFLIRKKGIIKKI